MEGSEVISGKKHKRFNPVPALPAYTGYAFIYLANHLPIFLIFIQ